MFLQIITMARFLLFSILFLSGTLIYGQNWQTDFEKAKETATKENKTLILVFQGSDWCAPCMKLEKEIWSSPKFIAYANEHYVLMKADFPRKKSNSLDAKQQEQNNKLAETYNKNGFFPLVVIFDKNTKVLGTTGYKNISPNAFIELLQSFIK